MPTRPLLLRISGIVIALIGLAVLGGGAWLVSLGGNWYYLLAGIGILLSGALLTMNQPGALWLFALVVLGTLVWAVIEAGFDWWPLAARGDIIFLIGIWLLLPWITQQTEMPAGRAWPWRQPHWRRGWFALGGSMVIAVIVGLVALSTDPHAISGSLPTAQASPPPNYAGVPDNDWRAYGRSSYGDRYSPLNQITPGNVGSLKVAWTFRTGDIRSAGDPSETTYEDTPLKVGDSLYVCTPHDLVIALDPDTGKEKWRFDPKIKELGKVLQHLTCRGVAYHEAAATGSSQAQGAGPAPAGQLPAAARMPADCPRRLFLPTADARLIALDADTGKPCASFGNDGSIDLTAGMPNTPAGEYYATSPPVTTQNLVIVGGEVTDDYSTNEPSGVIRAFDVNTGKLVWNWDADNPGETAPLAPGQSYVHNSPNSWSISSADEALGLIYVPMGNETPDEWAGKRNAVGEPYSSAIVALDIATGKVRWVFQTVHHDLWDMDIGSQPSLVDLDTKDGKVPALVAPTKRGDLYVLDRRTGQPIFPVTDRPVPGGAAPGDHVSPSQPFSSVTFLPPQPLKESDMWGATMFDQLACRIMFRQLRYGGIFTPPSTQGSLVFPGNFGIFDWGGIAIDPVRQIAFANPDYFAFVDRLIPRATADKGVDLSKVIPSGASGSQDEKEEGGGNAMFGTPYAVDLEPFRSPIGLPCQAPPWGYVAGLDLRTGKIVWMHKNGTVRDVTPVPLPLAMGVPSLGGPMATAGGVGFLTSTLDYYIRGYDITTGAQLWQDRLPAGGQATPMTYRSDKTGRQYVVAVAGGHGTLGTEAGDYVIAYALPPAP